MLPLNKVQQIIPRETKVWTGDCWRGFLNVRLEKLGLKMYVIDTDWGVGIIQKSQNEDNLEIKVELTYENFDTNRKLWMNIIKKEDFDGKNI